MPRPRAARRSDWKTEPLPENHTRVNLDRQFSAEELRRIQLGVIPEQMEDKWFVYWQDDQLFFHRSWTGFCTYIVDFEVTGSGASMASALLNRDPSQYTNTDDAHDAEAISYLIDVLLLHRPARFPSSHDEPGLQALEQWGVAGRASIGQHPNTTSDDED